MRGIPGPQDIPNPSFRAIRAAVRFFRPRNLSNNQSDFIGAEQFPIL
jgi:hypothetical protein